MFDLESAIAEWRRQMADGGVKPPGVLDELESHLRDDVERQVRSGAGAQLAFENAVHRFGDAGPLKQEFRRAETTELEEFMKQMAKIAVVVLGFFGMVMGLGMVLPALGRHNQHPGPWTADLLAPLFIGIAILVVGATAAFQGIRHNRQPRGRLLIKLSLLAAATFYLIPVFVTFVHARELNLVGWLIFSCAVAGAAWFFVSCYRFNRRLPSYAAP